MYSFSMEGSIVQPGSRAGQTRIIGNLRPLRLFRFSIIVNFSGKNIIYCFIRNSMFTTLTMFDVTRVYIYRKRFNGTICDGFLEMVR